MRNPEPLTKRGDTGEFGRDCRVHDELSNKRTDLARFTPEKCPGEVCYLTAQHLIDLSHLLGELATQSREFH
jgi:hypothetical protein